MYVLVCAFVYMFVHVYVYLCMDVVICRWTCTGTSSCTSSFENGVCRSRFSFHVVACIYIYTKIKTLAEVTPPFTGTGMPNSLHKPPSMHPCLHRICLKRQLKHLHLFTARACLTGIYIRIQSDNYIQRETAISITPASQTRACSSLLASNATATF